MTRFVRQTVSTAFAVMIASAFPLAQGPPAPGRTTRAPAASTQAGAPASATQAGAPAAAAQPAAPQATQFGPAANAEQTRDQLQQLFERLPPSLHDVLRTDPTLLSSADYLAPYPELASFLGQHPEVAHNPAYYVGTPDQARERDPQGSAMRMWEEMMQGLMILTVLLLVTSVLVWLVRTLVDYRRWIRLTRVQTETHTKLLDRLTSQDDLIAYMQTAAGRRFLESAPITLDPASRPLGAPLNRVLWSVQAGVVLALGGLGMLTVSRRVIPEVEQGLWAIGILALALGAGFIISAAIAYFLSNRLGLFEQRPPLTTDTLAGASLPPGRD